jgi:hypothetical protein
MVQQCWLGSLHPSLHWMRPSNSKLGAAPLGELRADSNLVAKAQATEFESVKDSLLSGPVPELESDGRIQNKLGCNHTSQLFWKC